MSCQRNQQFHLFNCDNTYSLNVVETLLEITKAKAKAKVDFEFSVEKHNFPTYQLAELCTDKIPRLKMDFAIFVVHANEPCLSINEDIAGIGYAKVYRALLQATGDRVIIVIGGDDNYKNQDEKDTRVISGWARRIISSQFTEEFLDGRKSFIFSWDKEHRPIHEEAMLHYFDNEKVGQKFDFQPKNQVLTSPVSGEDSEKPASASAIYRVPRSLYTSDVSQRSKTGTFGSGTRKREELSSNSALGARARVQDLVILGCNASDESVGAVYQVIQDLKPKLNLTSDPPIVNQAPGQLKSYLMNNKVKSCWLVGDAEAVKSTLENSQQRMEYEEVLKTALDKVGEKVIVAICGQPILLERDETTVTQAINSILQRDKKGSLVWLKDGQMKISSEALLKILQSVQDKYPVPSSNYSDGESTQRGLTGLQSADYEIVASVPESNQPYDQPSRAGHVMPHAPQITQNVPWPSLSNQPDNQLSRDGTINSLSADGGDTIATQSSNPTGVHGGRVYNLKGETVTLMIKAHLRNGKISKKDGDFCVRNWTVPEHIQAGLMSKYSDTSEAELLIFYDKSGGLRSYVTPKSKLLPSFVRNLMQKESPREHLAPKESLMLKSVIRNGKVSLRSEDVKHRYPGWQIPDDIIKHIEKNEWATGKADLLIISDEQGNLRSVVQLSAVHRVQNFFYKLKAHFE